MQGQPCHLSMKVFLPSTDTTSPSDTYTVWKLNYIRKRRHDLHCYIFDSPLKLVFKKSGGGGAGYITTGIQLYRYKKTKETTTTTKTNRENKQWKTRVNLSAVSPDSLFFHCSSSGSFVSFSEADIGFSVHLSSACPLPIQKVKGFRLLLLRPLMATVCRAEQIYLRRIGVLPGSWAPSKCPALILREVKIPNFVQHRMTFKAKLDWTND